MYPVIYEKAPVVHVSLDELVGKEISLGLYQANDTWEKHLSLDLERVSSTLNPTERESFQKKRLGYALSPKERKAFSRAKDKVQLLLNINS